MANIIKLGSLHLDGQPIKMGADYAPGQSIEVGETISGKEISWVVVNEMLIADRCVLTNVSWDDLNANNLIFGKDITIDGYHYHIRLLKVGAKKDEPNEWDAALDIVGKDNKLWHWEDIFFWGQETPRDYQASYRAIRGCNSARLWLWDNSSSRIVYIGFRPALVPLDTEQLGPTMLGRQLMLWGGQSIVSGRLEQMTDYDAVLSNWSGTRPTEKDFSSQLPNGNLVVNRKAIVGVQKS